MWSQLHIYFSGALRAANYRLKLKSGVLPVTLPELTEKIIYLGWFEDHPHNILVNHIILLYKQFIYKNRAAKVKVSIIGFKYFLKSVFSVEKGIAKKRNKVEIYPKKWNPFLTLI